MTLSLDCPNCTVISNLVFDSQYQMLVQWERQYSRALESDTILYDKVGVGWDVEYPTYRYQGIAIDKEPLLEPVKRQKGERAFLI